jgi:GTP-binding protein
VVRPLPSVVLVGRPNVGKSTLFNRMAGRRRAIVAPLAGTTRDIIAMPVSWQGATFQLSDTGGMAGASFDPLHDLVVGGGHRAIAGADLVLFVVDATDGKMSADEEIAAALRSSGKPVVLVLNKCDDRRAKAGSLEFYSLGFEPVVEVSAEHGHGIGDLLDEIIGHACRPRGEAHPTTAPTSGEADEPVVERDLADEQIETAVAIVGRPNVGKSSLVNRLLREERMLVSDMPGTTRDAVDVVLSWRRRRFRIVDTAGIRRAGKVAGAGAVEAVSVLQSRRAIASADVVVMLLDSVEGPTDQDGAIAGEADKAGRGLIVAANKWDLMKDAGPGAGVVFDDEVKRKLKFLEYAPLLHISAATGERVPKLLETIDRVAESRRRRVPTGELNRFVETIVAANPPVVKGRRAVRVLYATQVAIAPPTFVFFTNVATTFHFSYQRFLVNKLREAFGFVGTPIRIQVRARSRRH